MPAGQCPAEDIADLLGSVHLMRAVIELGISIPVLEFEFTENIQTAYLVALHLATSQGLLKARVTLGLLTGHGGEVDLDHPAVMEAYARHLFFRPWLSTAMLAPSAERWILLFAGANGSNASTR